MEILDIKKIFSKYNLKYTKQRKSVFVVLESSNSPMTAEAIFLKVKDLDNTISFSTVYRILDQYVIKNIALKSNINAENKSHFELNREEHKHYLVCSSCKTFVTISECPVETFQKIISNNTNFYITGHKLEIYGLCEKCHD